MEKFLLEEGDLVIGMDGSKVGKNVAVIDRNNKGSILIQRVARLRAQKNADLKYIYQRILSKEFQKYVDTVNTSSGIPHISLQQIKDFTISFPILPEQQKLASFFSLLDDRIQTQSKIIEGLKASKKALSKKIFTQEFRFSEFIDAWSIMRLGEIGDIIGGGTPKTNKDEYWNGNIQWFTPTEIKSNFVSKSQRTITELGLKNSSAKILPKGTILLTTRATIGEVAIALEECTTNQGFQSLVIKAGLNNVFIFNWIKENRFELVKKAKGSTFPEINKSEIEIIKLRIPTLQEQTKIADFLSAIDEKIEIETSILNLYTKQKQYLLRQMFI